MKKDNELIKKLELWKVVIGVFGSIIILIGIILTFIRTSPRLSDIEVEKKSISQSESIIEIREVNSEEGSENNLDSSKDESINISNNNRKNKIDTIKVLIPSKIKFPDLWIGDKKIQLIKKSPTVLLGLVDNTIDLSNIELRSEKRICKHPIIGENKTISFVLSNCFK